VDPYAADLETLERATVEAVAPWRLHALDGWLAPVDPGPIGRARSAVPLRHDARLAPETLDRIEALYRAGDVAPGFRMADAPGLEPAREALATRGYAPVQPTLFLVGGTAGLLALTSAPAEVADAPDAAWAAAFGGEGFDPADAERRLANYRRSAASVFAAVREGGEVLAVGVGAFGRGWVSVQAMRTTASRRGEGLAGRVLAAIGLAAEARGYHRVCLQVEEPNVAARALYGRAGLRAVWRYRYWR
jgi:GNAT superfamily N-acetyltransferase